jgi:non-specific serine/threonine protein kinase
MSALKGKSFEIEGKLYKFIDHIDNGGNASVWKVENEGNQYAVKILNKNKKQDRFENEIKFCENYNHENLIQILAHGEVNNKACYVMPLYESNLAQFIKNEPSIEEGFEIIFQICGALKFLHDNNVIHRDLKPENILIKGKKLVLADLGIAHFNNSVLTSEKDLLANRGYAAPEQKIKGKAKEITTAVDIFSLGVIINEIFTNKKPEGSSYTLISDVYPWLIDIDKLVDRCLRQNPAERPTIKEASLELKLKFGELQNEIESIKKNLTDDFEYECIECSDKTKKKIINQACYDILTAKYFLKNKSNQELLIYNDNYNCNMHYKVDEELKMEYVKFLLKKSCKRKFLSECAGYNDPPRYVPLDLMGSLDDKKLYKELLSFLQEHFIVDGELLKLFSSCCYDHCKEILNGLNAIQNWANELDDAPILYIVKEILRIKGSNRDIKLENQILVNWNQSVLNYNRKSVNCGLFKEDHQEKEINKVLDKFIKKYKPVVTRNNTGIIVRFDDEKLYNAFKNYALNLSRPNYKINGDVLDLVRIEKVYDGVIELKPWDPFDITIVLAKVLGLRNDY